MVVVRSGAAKSHFFAITTTSETPALEIALSTSALFGEKTTVSHFKISSSTITVPLTLKTPLFGADLTRATSVGGIV